jgi:hypothetical protein
MNNVFNNRLSQTLSRTTAEKPRNSTGNRPGTIARLELLIEAV